MDSMKDLFKSADWKTEKHIPVIDVVSATERGKTITVNVSVGKEIPHPNTTEHYISSIEVYFLPEGAKFPYLLGKSSFDAHGASTDGPNTSTVYTEPTHSVNFKTEKNGKLFATAYCNIHGLWENSQNITLK